jgi:hypothetical protein
MKKKCFLIFVWRHLWYARVSLEGRDTTSYSLIPLISSSLPRFQNNNYCLIRRKTRTEKFGDQLRQDREAEEKLGII